MRLHDNEPYRIIVIAGTQLDITNPKNCTIHIDNTVPHNAIMVLEGSYSYDGIKLSINSPKIFCASALYQHITSKILPHNQLTSTYHHFQPPHTAASHATQPTPISSYNIPQDHPQKDRNMALPSTTANHSNTNQPPIPIKYSSGYNASKTSKQRVYTSLPNIPSNKYTPPIVKPNPPKLTDYQTVLVFSKDLDNSLIDESLLALPDGYNAMSVKNRTISTNNIRKIKQNLQLKTGVIKIIGGEIHTDAKNIVIKGCNIEYNPRSNVDYNNNPWSHTSMSNNNSSNTNSVVKIETILQNIYTIHVSSNTACHYHQ